MARTTRDLAGARFGEPWQARTRQGVPVKPPTWRIIATLPDGEQVIVARRGRTDAEAYERVDALRKRPFGAHAGTRWTMQEVWENWWEATQSSTKTLSDGSRGRSDSRWQDSTRVRYRGIWERHLRETWGERDPQSVTRSEIYEWLHDDGRNVQPKMLLDALRIVCRHADNIGLCTDPTRGGFQLTTKAPVPRPLSIDELDRIEARLAGVEPSPRQPDARRLHDGWVIMRSSGARISEVLSLQVQDWDSKSQRLWVGRRHIAKVWNGQTEKGTLAVVEGTKTRAGQRRIPVTPDGAAVLDARCAGREPVDFIIANADGRWVSTNSFSNGLFREMRTLDIEATAHDLRDTISSLVARELVARRGWHAGLQAAARMLGHASTKTLPHYVDSGDIVDSDVVDVMTNVADPAVQRVTRVQEVALGLNLVGLGYADVDEEPDGALTVRVAALASEFDQWVTAFARFGTRVAVVHETVIEPASGDPALAPSADMDIEF